MLDINAEVESVLDTTGYNVVFRYPQNLKELPVAAFYTVSETGEMSADNCEMFRRGVVGIDIFAKDPAQCTKMSQKIMKAMQTDNWSMTETADGNSETDGVFRRNMKFVKSFYVFE